MTPMQFATVAGNRLGTLVKSTARLCKHFGAWVGLGVGCVVGFAILLFAAVVIAPFGLVQWKDPADTFTWAIIGLAGLCGGLGHYFVAQAHRYATAATLGPFLYQQILYMTLLGWLVFAQVPDALVIAGATVVVTLPPAADPAPDTV